MSTKPKVVLQLIESWGPGGAETIVVELCKKLDKKLYSPIVGLLNDGWLNQELIKNGIETIIIKNKYPYDPFCIYQLVKIIRDRGVSLVHSHEFMMNSYGTLASILTKRPNIATIHGKNYYCEKKSRRTVYRFMSLLATRIVAVSDDLKRFVAKKIGMNPDKISVIYNGIETKRFANGNEKGVENEFKNNGPIIGAIGNLYPVKGHIYLLQAAQKIVGKYPSALFIIIGKKTRYSEDLQREVVRLGMGKNIQFLGFRDDIPDLVRAMDIFVLPSLDETFSIATIEAMAASKPVVATKCGGPEEIVIDGETGFLVPVKDPDAMAEKILTLLEDGELSKKMGNAGRERVMATFNLDVMFNSYSKIYEDLLNRSASGSGQAIKSNKTTDEH